MTRRVVLSLLAHPDDAEFLCAGTLALLRARGWKIHIATMTSGDCGSSTLPPSEISAIRRKEGVAAAAVLAGTFHVLGCRDGCIRHDVKTVRKAVRLLRRIQPALVFTHRPSCYLYDHEVTSLIGREATFWCTVPNFAVSDTLPLEFMPHLYYADPMEGKDILGTPITPTMLVDITSVIEIKRKMLRHHASQQAWLRKQHGVDEYVHQMELLARSRGRLAGFKFAEGFRQHLGHAYPQDDLLNRELGDSIRRFRASKT